MYNQKSLRELGMSDFCILKALSVYYLFHQKLQFSLTLNLRAQKLLEAITHKENESDVKIDFIKDPKAYGKL